MFDPKPSSTFPTNKNTNGVVLEEGEEGSCVEITYQGWKEDVT